MLQPERQHCHYKPVVAEAVSDFIQQPSPSSEILHINIWELYQKLNITVFPVDPFQKSCFDMLLVDVNNTPVGFNTIVTILP